MNKYEFSAPWIFGEVLFDCFPDGNSVLGGAPFNVAWHLQAFAQSPVMISAVGNDVAGAKVRAAMQRWNMPTAGLQLDPGHPTGSVTIRFEDGEPHYTIVEHSAYDYISADRLPQRDDNSLLYHGTLALRNPASRQTLSAIKKAHQGGIFMDVNLRDPWWHKDHVQQLLTDADWVKLNAGELSILSGDKGDIESRSRAFLHRYQLQGLVVTLGDKGAVGFTAEEEDVRVNPDAKLEVVDTVGAGDAFTSVLILGLLQQWPLELSMQRAQQFASLMVGQQGATVQRPDFYQPLIDAWSL